MRTIVRIVIVLSIHTIYTAFAQSAAADATLASHAKARAILERSLRAHGITNHIDAARSFDLRASLINTGIHQSPDPEPPMGTFAVKGRYVVDAAKNRFFVDTDARFTSFAMNTRTLSINGKGHLIDRLAKTIVAEDNELASFPLLVRILPQNLLADAVARSATLRWAGATSARNHRLEQISFARSNADLYTLSIDAATGIVQRVAFLQQHVIDGDVAFIHEYGDYRRQDGLLLPFAYTTRRGPWIVSRGTIDSLVIGASSLDSDFQLPPDHRTIAAYDPQMRIESVSPGVHMVRYVPGGYTVLAVEFQDHLVVVETPEANTPNGTSARVVAALQQRFPGKPLRYAIPTHHHSDHVGGIRDYIAAGATIVSTRGNAAFLRRVASTPFTIIPDTLSRTRTRARFEFIDGGARVFADHTQELRIYKLQPAPPHVKEMLIAYLPKQRLLFQTDLFNAWSCFRQPVPNEDIGHTNSIGDTQALIQNVERLRLPVDKVFGGHGREVDYAWLKAFAERRAADRLPMWACNASEML